MLRYWCPRSKTNGLACTAEPQKCYSEVSIYVRTLRQQVNWRVANFLISSKNLHWFERHQVIGVTQTIVFSASLFAQSPYCLNMLNPLYTIVFLVVANSSH